MMTPVQKLQLKNAVERVLHAPCNKIKDNLEWTFVFDGNLSKEELASVSKEIVITLKQYNPIFRNARLNVVEWKSDTECSHKVVPMPSIQMGTYFGDYQSQRQEKKIEDLAAQLKLYQARSKLIILLSDGNFHLENTGKWKENIYPFLIHRMFIFSENACKFIRELQL